MWSRRTVSETVFRQNLMRFSLGCRQSFGEVGVGQMILDFFRAAGQMAIVSAQSGYPGCPLSIQPQAIFQRAGSSFSVYTPCSNRHLSLLCTGVTAEQGIWVESMIVSRPVAGSETCATDILITQNWFPRV